MATYTYDSITVTDTIYGNGVTDRSPVKVATTVAGTLASSFVSGNTIDGVTISLSDRLLIKNQASAIENGIYIVTAGTPQRADDCYTGNTVGGMSVYVRSGTTNANTVWSCNSAVGFDTVDTDPITFFQRGQVTFTGAESISNKTITSSTIDSTPIGNSSANTGKFTSINGQQLALTNVINQIVLGVTNTTTLTFPAPASNITLTFPITTDTMVGRATTDTLTNKTLTSPTINGGVLSGGSINNMTIGASVASTGRFTSISVTNTTNQIALGTTNVLTVNSPQTGTATLTLPDLVNTSDTAGMVALAQTMTNKTLTSNTNNIIARGLWVASGASSVSVFAATAPTTGQVLTATSSSTATWQTPSGGGGGSITVQEVSSGSTNITSIVLSGTPGAVLSFSGTPFTMTIAAGSWHISFSSSASLSTTTSRGMGIGITTGATPGTFSGTPDTRDSQRRIYTGGTSGSYTMLYCETYITVASSTVVNVNAYFTGSSSTATFTQGTMTAVKYA